jgi:hypothetical protein
MNINNFFRIGAMKLNDSDFEWLKKNLRNEFDEHREPYQFDEDLQIIDRARRFGLNDLADSMQNDIMISAHVNVNNISR